MRLGVEGMLTGVAGFAGAGTLAEGGAPPLAPLLCSCAPAAQGGRPKPCSAYLAPAAAQRAWAHQGTHECTGTATALLCRLPTT